jgi:hypothetical protein
MSFGSRAIRLRGRSGRRRRGGSGSFEQILEVEGGWELARDAVEG